MGLLTLVIFLAALQPGTSFDFYIPCTQDNKESTEGVDVAGEMFWAAFKTGADWSLSFVGGPGLGHFMDAMKNVYSHKSGQDQFADCSDSLIDEMEKLFVTQLQWTYMEENIKDMFAIGTAEEYQIEIVNLREDLGVKYNQRIQDWWGQNEKLILETENCADHLLKIANGEMGDPTGFGRWLALETATWCIKEHFGARMIRQGTVEICSAIQRTGEAGPDSYAYNAANCDLWVYTDAGMVPNLFTYENKIQEWIDKFVSAGEGIKQRRLQRDSVSLNGCLVERQPPSYSQNGAGNQRIDGVRSCVFLDSDFAAPNNHKHIGLKCQNFFAIQADLLNPDESTNGDSYDRNCGKATVRDVSGTCRTNDGTCGTCDMLSGEFQPQYFSQCSHALLKYPWNNRKRMYFDNPEDQNSFCNDCNRHQWSEQALDQYLEKRAKKFDKRLDVLKKRAFTVKKTKKKRQSIKARVSQYRAGIIQRHRITSQQCQGHCQNDQDGCETGYFCLWGDLNGGTCSGNLCSPCQRYNAWVADLEPHYGVSGTCPNKWLCFVSQGHPTTLEKSDQISKSCEPLTCVAIDSILTIDNEEVEIQDVEHALVSANVYMHDVESVDEALVFVDVVHQQATMLDVATLEGKSVRATPGHLFHNGSMPCCSYSSFRPLSDFSVGDQIWIMKDGEPFSDTIDSISDEVVVSAYASVSAMNRIYSTQNEFTQGCDYNLKDSVLINDFITTSHGANVLDIFAKREHRLLLEDSIMDELFLGAEQLDLDFLTVLNEDDEWADLWHNLMSLLTLCGFDETSAGEHECGPDIVDIWFLRQKEDGAFTDEMEYALDMAILAHEGEVLAAVSSYFSGTTEVSKGQFFYTLIEHFRLVAAGNCINTDTSLTLRLLLNVFSLAIASI